MKAKIFLLVFFMSTFGAVAQVSTHYFDSKDAFQVFPALKSLESKDAVCKNMPRFDVRQLLG
jgi:hypothetical protein